MKKLSLTTLIIAMFTTLAFNQNLTQTVRGTLIDADSKLPLIFATVMIPGSDPLIGTVSDLDGTFKLVNIPVGRITLQFSYLGYEDKTIPNIEVNSGKEVVLNLNMQESAVKLDEVVIKAYKNKGEALNNMALISARSISVEETKRYAGGFSDPSRILSSFAGVANSPNGENDIIVRGNSPKYVQWRLEGVEISNPSHFGDQNSIKGGISALNNNLLATSDFYTGAFSPEYGDVLSGVYDVKLRAGNNEKFESAIGFGILGTDLTLEGPFKKGYAGSYLVNYRYSTASLINDLGLVDVDGDLKFQDATFKVVLPTKNMGIFSFFGLGGLSGFLQKDIKPDGQAIPGNKIIQADIIKDYDKGTYLFNTGMNHTLSINNNSFITTSLSYSGSGLNDDVFESGIIKIYNGEGGFSLDTMGRTLNYKSKSTESKYRGAITYSNKLNAKNKIKAGTKYAFINYDYNQSWLQDDGVTRFTAVDFDENVSTVSNFISWRYRLNEDITIVSGLHNMNVLFNNKRTLEPRIAVNWKLNSTSSVHAGYGQHSTMESIHNYFAKVELEDGSIIEPNTDLDLLKAHHYVVGYEKRFTEHLMAKIEVYYQGLYDLPVENIDTSYYATINEGTDFRYVDLVNEGT
nr:TonB-dependent receptor [Bacteroidota bacterium]